MQETTKSNKKQYYFAKLVTEDMHKILFGTIDPGQVLTMPDERELFVTDNLTALSDHIEQIYGYKTAFNDRLFPNQESVQFEWGRGDKEDETFFVYAAKSIAEPLSRALYSVVKPGQDGLYARVYDNTISQDVYSLLEFRRKDIVPIALGADPTPLANALAITVEDGALTQEEVDNIVGAISVYAGQEINLVDFIPASWADKQIDKQTALNMGYNVLNLPTEDPNN